MGLMQHQTPRMVIPLLHGNTVAVRGLGLDDFAALLPNHLESMTKIVELYQQHQRAVFTTKSFTDFLIATGKDFPGMMLEVISMAADEPEFAEGRVKLGSGLQVAVLTGIMKMTVEDAGGLGNLLGQLKIVGANVLAAAQELAEAKPGRPSSNSTGTGGSK